jgi:hypothetical protein
MAHPRESYRFGILDFEQIRRKPAAPAKNLAQIRRSENNAPPTNPYFYLQAIPPIVPVIPQKRLNDTLRLAQKKTPSSDQMIKDRASRKLNLYPLTDWVLISSELNSIRTDSIRTKLLVPNPKAGRHRHHEPHWGQIFAVRCD